MGGSDPENLELILHEVEQAEREVVLNPENKLQILRQHALAAKARGGERESFLFIRMYNICNARDSMNEGTTNIHLSGITGSLINIGKINGNISANISVLSSQGGEQANVADNLKRIADAITSSTSLSERGKKEALEVVEHMSSQASEPPEKRSTGVLKSMLKSFPDMISTAADALAVWAVVGPPITAYFGIG